MSVRKGNLPIEVLSSKGETSDGREYTYDGNYYTEYDDNGNAENSMLRVPFGNEQNPTSFNNAHVCSWFVNYGNDTIGGTSDYETPIKNVDKLGGLCVINHPGEYSGARNVANYDEAYNTDNVKFKYVVDKFANILEKYPACLGIDVNSKGDYRTRYDSFGFSCFKRLFRPAETFSVLQHRILITRASSIPAIPSCVCLKRQFPSLKLL